MITISHKQLRRSWLSLLPRPFPFMLWVFLSFPWACAMSTLIWSEDSGGAENGKRKTCWVAWDIMLRPKSHGGLGFRDMHLFNQALLARQAWCLIQFPNTQCARLLRAKYFPNGSLIDTIFTGNKSSTWAAIEYGLELLKQVVIWRVGNGRKIHA